MDREVWRVDRGGMEGGSGRYGGWIREVWRVDGGWIVEVWRVDQGGVINAQLLTGIHLHT